MPNALPDSFVYSYHGAQIENYFLNKSGRFDPISESCEAQGIFLCFTNRCGSTLVAAEASALGFAGKANDRLNFEFFNSDFVIEHSEQNGIGSFCDYVKTVAKEFSSASNFFLSKCSIDQTVWLSKVGVIGGAFKCPIYLRVIRRDLLAQAVSYLIAEQTGRWTSLHGGRYCTPIYNRTSIENAMSYFASTNSEADLYFRPSQEEVIEFIYEEVVVDLNLIRVKLEEKTKIHTNRGSRSLDVRMQRSALNDEWERRFKEESISG